jgi:hypothetical protein
MLESLEIIRSISDNLKELNAQRGELPGKVQIDTDQLDSIAAQFGAHAAEIDQILAELAPHITALRSPLHSQNNARLNAELDELIIPNIRYLKHHYLSWQRQVSEISVRIQKLAVVIEETTRHIQTPDDVRTLAQNNTLGKIGESTGEGSASE